TDIPLWEFTSDDDPRMGYLMEPPTVGLAYWGKNKADPRWTAFVPNGYNSATQTTGFFMIDLEGGLDGTWTKGTDYRFIAFETVTGATGLSPIRQLDLDLDRVIDRVYAADLKGNIWSATYTSTGNSTWIPSHGATPLFTAQGADASGATV